MKKILHLCLGMSSVLCITPIAEAKTVVEAFTVRGESDGGWDRGYSWNGTVEKAENQAKAIAIKACEKVPGEITGEFKTLVSDCDRRKVWGGADVDFCYAIVQAHCTYDVKEP